MSSNEGKYRYPGTRYFTSEDKDIFHGRKKDSRRLHAQIMSCETVVLHGDSGLGKSSLIQAGIIPLLKEKNTNYVPVTIRFNSNTASLASSIGDVAEQDDYLIRKTIRKIDKHVGIPDVDLPFISKKEADLWCVAKQFEKKGQSLLLIFDQFENIGVYGQEQIDHFKNKLAELFKRAIPAAIDEEIDLKSEEVDLEQLSEEEKKQFNADLNFLEDPLSVKIVFVVREDKLGIMSLLSDAFPNILKNDYKLSAFDRESAIEAITIPAGLPKKEIYEVQSFQFSDDALLKLLNELKDEESGKYDPLQIQILCSSIERGVENNIDQEADVCYQIIADDIPRAKDVIKGFYNRIWQVVQEKLELEDGEFTRLRKKIIKHFEIREKRNLVHEGTLFKIERGKEIIEILEEEGLILKNPIGSNIYYWLCHDRLVNPLLQDLEVLRAAKQAQEEAKQALHEREERLQKIAIETKRLRDEQERIEKDQQRKFTWYSIVISILSISLASIIYLNYVASETERNSEEEKILYLSKSLRTTNPTLSYKIAKEWSVENQGDISDEFNNYITQYDSSTYSYLINVFPTFGEVVSVDWNFESEKLIIDEHYTSIHWNTEDNSIKKSFPNDGKRIKILNYDGGTHQLIAYDDSLTLYDSVGNYIQSYPNEENNPDLIKISKNGRFMYMDGFIYNFQTAELIHAFPDDGIIAIEFFKNEKFFAVGLWDGTIDVYSLNENNIKLTKKLQSSERTINSEVTTMTIDPNDQFLVAGNRQNKIEIWSLDDLEGTIGDFENKKNTKDRKSVV